MDVTEKTVVLLDMDGVLVDIERGWLNRWRELYPDRFWKPVEERRTFYVEDEYPKEFANDIRAIWHEEGFFFNQVVVPGAVEAVKEMADAGLELWICSTPTGSDFSAKEKQLWVNKHFPDLRRKVILTKDKTMVRGDFLIDDKPNITGIYKPEWQHLLFRDFRNDGEFTWADWRKFISV